VQCEKPTEVFTRRTPSEPAFGAYARVSEGILGGLPGPDLLDRDRHAQFGGDFLGDLSPGMPGVPGEQDEPSATAEVVRGDSPFIPADPGVRQWGTRAAAGLVIQLGIAQPARFGTAVTGGDG
jgi:hypothetical protein